MPGDNASVLDFLRWTRPAGPWVLTAIPPEGGRTSTETFNLDSTAALERFLDAHNGQQNLYWMVNVPRGPLTSKATKEDVEALEFLHVDVDPSKGRDLATERKRILAHIRGFTPAPSAIIDSGGGYQAFWRLDEPLYLGGNSIRIAEAEAYNQQLELLLGGDHCYNADRIMRLPGTVNLPTEKKRRAGREPTPALVVELTALAYPLSTFTAAPRVQGTNGAEPEGQVRLSGNLSPVLIDDLPETVSPRLRSLIIQGDDPDDATKYASRSEVVWAVACGLVRAGCHNDTIASILLDKDYAISGHVLSQRRPVEYAARQIQKAREEVEEPWLRRLNDHHAVIADLGGKCRIISEVMDLTFEQPRTRISKQSFEDFRNRYMNQYVEVGHDPKGNPQFKGVGSWWLAHPMRRQFNSLVFAPRREIEGAYNLWRGFICEAVPSGAHETFLQHVHDVICSGSDEHYAYLVCWMARCVQRPGQAGEVAVVLRGGRGTGKGTFVVIFGSLWGRHFLHVSSAKHLVGQFNAHLRDCVVLFADEAFFAGDKQHESVLKTLITEDTLVIEGKGVDAEVAPNYVHLLMSSNADWVVPAGGDERRFYVLDVSDTHKQDSRYFAELRRSMANGGREALLHYLLNVDLTGFDVRAVPQTEALRDQKLHSLSPEEQWWLERLMDGRIVASVSEWHTDILKERLQGDYLRYAEGQRLMRRISPTALGKFLGRVMPSDFPRSQQRMTDIERDDGNGQLVTIKERAYFYQLPTLEACRMEWDRRYGGPYQWPAEMTMKRSGGDEPY